MSKNLFYNNLAKQFEKDNKTMAIITKTQILSTNPEGKSVDKNSYVQFKTWKQNDPVPLNHAGNINQNSFSQDITNVLLDMKQGDKVELKVENQQKEQMVLELVQVRDGQEFSENHQKAQAFKNQGNEQIKLKDYEKAAHFYQKGLNLVQYDCSPESQPIKISLLSNLTLAYLNTKKYQECIKTCDQYLTCSLQPNKKIVYRKANANKSLKNWQQAQNDINFGLQICQNDEQGKKDFEALSEVMKKEKKIQAEKDKKVYSKMFG